MPNSGELPRLLEPPPKITDKSKDPHHVAVARYWLGVMREQLKGAQDARANHRP